jgi:hypothetical protein
MEKRTTPQPGPAGESFALLPPVVRIVALATLQVFYAAVGCQTVGIGARYGLMKWLVSIQA